MRKDIHYIKLEEILKFDTGHYGIMQNHEKETISQKKVLVYFNNNTIRLLPYSAEQFYNSDFFSKDIENFYYYKISDFVKEEEYDKIVKVEIEYKFFVNGILKEHGIDIYYIER